MRTFDAVGLLTVAWLGLVVQGEYIFNVKLNRFNNDDDDNDDDDDDDDDDNETQSTP